MLHKIIIQELKVHLQENLRLPAETVCENFSTESYGTSLHIHDSEKVNIQNTGPPQLPDRNYLNDIDFVIQEYDLILSRSPQLPPRSATTNFKNLPTEEQPAKSDQIFCSQLEDSNAGAAAHSLVLPNVYNLTLPRTAVRTASPTFTSSHGSKPCGYPTNLQCGPPQISYSESPSTSQAGQQQLLPKAKSHRMVSKEQLEREGDMYQNIHMHSLQHREPELETNVYQSLVFHHRDSDEYHYMEVGKSLYQLKTTF